MFALGAGMDIGERNQAAVKEQLTLIASSCVPPTSVEAPGRTMRVFAKQGMVNVHVAGGKPETLLAETAPAARPTALRSSANLKVAGASA